MKKHLFTDKNTYTEDKEKIYQIIMNWLRTYTGNKKRFFDMPRLNFTLINRILAETNLIIDSYEYDKGIFEAQERIKKELGISRKLNLYNMPIDLGAVTNKKKAYAGAFIDTIHGANKSLFTTLLYLNADFAAITVTHRNTRDYAPSIRQYPSAQAFFFHRFYECGYKQAIDKITNKLMEPFVYDSVETKTGTRPITVYFLENNGLWN